MAALLAAVLDVAPEILAALGAVMTLLGMQSSVASIISNIQASSGGLAITYYQALRDVCNSVFSADLSRSAVWPLNIGWEYARNLVLSNIDSKITMLTPAPYNPPAPTPQPTPAPTPTPTTTITPTPIPYPAAFNTMSELQSWWALVTEMINAGQLTQESIDSLTELYNREYIRLSAIPVTVPQPTPVVVTPATPVVTPYPTVVTPTPAGVAFNPEITVNVPAQAAPTVLNNINVAQPINNIALDTAGITSVIGALGITFAAEFAKNASQIQHNANAGRNACMPSAGQAMLNSILGAVAPLATTLAIEQFSPLRDMMDRIFTGAWDQVLGDPALQSPVTPERAPAISRALFMDALKAGQTAHLLGVLAESFAPLKTLGLGQMAAFLGDMAGFAKIGGAMMSAVEAKAISVPFGYYINSHVRSMIPDIRGLQAFAGEYTLLPEERRAQLTASEATLEQLELEDKAEFMRWAPYSGFSDHWNELFYRTTHRPVSIFTLRYMADAGMYDEAYSISALAHMGYEPAAIRQTLAMLRRIAIKDTRDLLSNEGRYDYIDGFLTADTYRANLLALGKDAQEANALVSATTKRRERDMDKRKTTLLSSMVVKGKLELADMRDELTAMGYQPDAIALTLAETQIKITAEKTPLKMYETASGKMTVDNIRTKRTLLIIPRVDEVAQLTGLQMPADLIEATADNDDLEIRKKEIAKIKLPMPAYQTDAGKIQWDTIRVSRRAETTTREDEVVALAALDMPADLIESIAGLDDLRIELAAAKRVVVPTPRYQTEAGRTELDTIRRARQAEAITREQETDALAELEMSNELVIAIADNDDLRLALAAAKKTVTE